jgi:hypothetical protein
MKKHAIGGVVVGLCLSFMASMASASTISGPIQRLLINAGSNSSPRVSIYLGGNTACSNKGWFAYEAASTGLGLVRTNGLLAAYSSKRSVTIQGTGTCDAFAVEKVQDVDLR